MKDYSGLSDFEINKLVAEALGNRNVTLPAECLSGSVVSYTVYGSGRLNLCGLIEVSSYEVRKDFCNNPADAWPIILENKISINHWCTGEWTADAIDGDFVFSDTPLRAAMIVYLQMMEQKL